jgi:hypothetical protein
MYVTVAVLARECSYLVVELVELHSLSPPLSSHSFSLFLSFFPSLSPSAFFSAQSQSRTVDGDGDGDSDGDG